MKKIIELANSVAQRSNCAGQKVGAVIFDLLDPDVIISVATNMSTSNCDRIGGCNLGTSCIQSNLPSKAIHAEMKAIVEAFKMRADLSNCGIFVTHAPCINCVKLICCSGIQQIHLSTESLRDARWCNQFDFINDNFLAPFGVKIVGVDHISSQPPTAVAI